MEIYKASDEVETVSSAGYVSTGVKMGFCAYAIRTKILCTNTKYYIKRGLIDTSQLIMFITAGMLKHDKVVQSDMRNEY